ncbi:MAG: cupin domain-containing protein [Chloroflexia bacterium]
MPLKVVHSSEVPAAPVEELEGVSVRWLITREDGAPHFAMRLFELQPGSSAPEHRHPWEHEVYVLEGQGVVRTEEREQPLVPGTAVFVPGGLQHQFRNNGAVPLRFLCLIPHTA